MHRQFKERIFAEGLLLFKALVCRLIALILHCMIYCYFKNDTKKKLWQHCRMCPFNKLYFCLSSVTLNIKYLSTKFLLNILFSILSKVWNLWTMILAFSEMHHGMNKLCKLLFVLRLTAYIHTAGFLASFTCSSWLLFWSFTKCFVVVVVSVVMNCVKCWRPCTSTVAIKDQFNLIET